jgi:ABC-type nitrate/sulfonate/bicarbonate transport system permease component
MLFAELFASTAGLGFVMTVASATYQNDKGLAAFFITVVLLAVISATLRWSTKPLDFSEESLRIVSAIHDSQVKNVQRL